MFFLRPPHAELLGITGGRGQSSALAFVRVFKCEVVLAARLTPITLRNCQGLVRIYRFCLYLNKDCLLKSSLIHKKGICICFVFFVFCVTKEKCSNMGGWNLGNDGFVVFHL